MPPMHLRHGLGYCSDMRTEVAGNIGHPSLGAAVHVLIRPRSTPGVLRLRRRYIGGI